MRLKIIRTFPSCGGSVSMMGGHIPCRLIISSCRCSYGALQPRFFSSGLFLSDPVIKQSGEYPVFPAK